MKIIGLDVGSKTIGIAVSDALGVTAQGLKTIQWDENDFKTADRDLASIIKEHEIEKAVIGLPKNMNNTIGVRGKISENYAAYIERKYKLPTVLWDERLSTVAAERILLEADMSRRKRKKLIDKMAAAMILQGYLDQRN